MEPFQIKLKFASKTMSMIANSLIKVSKSGFDQKNLIRAKSVKIQPSLIKIKLIEQFPTISDLLSLRPVSLQDQFFF